MKYMRIVGNGIAGVFVQTSKYKHNAYTQVIMKHEEFETFMKENFPKYWEEFLKSKETNSAEYFYYYGETEEMRRKGIAYIFEAETV